MLKKYTKTKYIQLHILPKHPHNCQKTHTLQKPHIDTPLQSYQYIVTSSREPQNHNSDTVNKFHLTCIEDEKISPNRIKSVVFHHFRFCKNESWKYLSSLIWYILHVNCLLHFFYILSIFLQKLRPLFSTTFISVVIDCIYFLKLPVSCALI